MTATKREEGWQNEGKRSFFRSGWGGENREEGGAHECDCQINEIKTSNKRQKGGKARDGELPVTVAKPTPTGGVVEKIVN